MTRTVHEVSTLFILQHECTACVPRCALQLLVAVCALSLLLPVPLVVYMLQVVHKAALLPALRDGDWLMFPFAGAYTICAASNYGGVRFTQALKLFIYSEGVHRDTGGWDLAVGETAAAAASWNVPKGADGSCCDSECAVAPGVAVSIDSDNISVSAEDCGSGSPHSVCEVRAGGGVDGSLSCLFGGDQDAQQGCGGGGCVCGGVAAVVDDGCMSVASEGTAAVGMVLEGCGESQVEAESAMVII